MGNLILLYSPKACGHAITVLFFVIVQTELYIFSDTVCRHSCFMQAANVNAVCLGVNLRILNYNTSGLNTLLTICSCPTWRTRSIDASSCSFITTSTITMTRVLALFTEETARTCIVNFKSNGKKNKQWLYNM